MFKPHTVLLALTALLPLTGYAESPAATSNEMDPSEIQRRSQESMKVIKSMAEELQGHLKGALAEGNPAKAIEVCNQIAPTVASRLSQENGWTIRRTTLKTRNANNAPDSWEQQTLKEFAERQAKGESLEKMTKAEVVTNADQKPEFRFMKAIPTAEKPCLMCHGETIKPELAEKIKTLYPNDSATGFKTGDLRGAFSVRQPL